MHGYEPRGSGVRENGVRGGGVRGKGKRGGKSQGGVRGAIKGRLGIKPAGFDEKERKWDEIWGETEEKKEKEKKEKKEKKEEKEKGGKGKKKVKKSESGALLVKLRSEKEKHFDSNSQGI